MKSMSKSLVIVESPAKARTIRKFLGSNYEIEASIGHVRDLPQGAKELPEKYRGEDWAYLGVDVDHDFEPVYIVSKEKKKQVDKLKSLLKEADELYLATDEDREGEAISWHLCQVLKPKVPVHRLVFHEITKKAILSALENPRQINESLVRAQETRRILDRLFGYDVSPLLWRKVRPKLSAGRVQSVAVRLIVDRERQRMAFRSATYWDLLGLFETKQNQNFHASLESVNGRRIPASRDFDAGTGVLKNKDCLQMTEAEVLALLERLKKTPEAVITKVENKDFVQRPPAPFTTSTLQQEANRKYGFTARRTMTVAQSLYENGYITYMRTDSTALSEEALNASRELVRKIYGKEYLPAHPRHYQTKVKNAQEAHEAIRPAGTVFQMPEEVQSILSPDEFKLFDMIWKRTVACQMVDAVGQRKTIALRLDDADFTTSGKTITFPGYLRAYIEGTDEMDEPDGERILPPVAEGEKLFCRELDPKVHTTQPPNRFSEAALTRTLEEKGIGRPSTYASIIETILARNYVFKRGNVLIPTWVAFAVCKLLETHLPDLIDYQFTAEMEDDLDAISRGEREWIDYLQEFYFGDETHSGAPSSDPQTGRKKETVPGLRPLLANMLDQIDAREISTIEIGVPEDGGEPLHVRVGRYGPFLEQGEIRVSIPESMAPDELTVEKGLELLANAHQGEEPLGMDPESGKPIYVKVGRYGPYIQCGDADDEEKPRNASLLKGMDPAEVDLETAVKLLQLPRTLGVHPEDGAEIVASNGRYGPYVKWNEETRSLPDDVSPIDVTLEQAVQILAQPKNRRGGGTQRAAAARQAAKVLGKSPVTEEDVRMMAGRFGPYVTDGTTNASLPRTADPEALTLEEALELLAARAAKAPAKKKAVKKTAKKAAKKATKKATKKTAKKAAKKVTKKASEEAENVSETEKKVTKKAAKKATKKAEKKTTAKKTEKKAAKKVTKKAAKKTVKKAAAEE
ncbi:MAG: type I DNA topoisomerase [Thermoguttaceae bacterium]|nr:type I DNA topoisomerase [Thermoguttaceae bacterium]